MLTGDFSVGQERTPFLLSLLSRQLNRALADAVGPSSVRPDSCFPPVMSHLARSMQGLEGLRPPCWQRVGLLRQHKACPPPGAESLPVLRLPPPWPLNEHLPCALKVKFKCSLLSQGSEQGSGRRRHLPGPPLRKSIRRGLLRLSTGEDLSIPLRLSVCLSVHPSIHPSQL